MDYAIVFLPLLGSIIAGFFGKILGTKFSQIATCLLVSIKQRSIKQSEKNLNQTIPIKQLEKNLNQTV